ncbi:dynamin family protein [Hydrotalea sandarakina]|jgi:small GTP-binding protein|uniref:Small GTP-binding protein n=1 Tax=Hydrotalea sandarakina TaxID=1004304 RepID=A0A2W7SGQ1_9BACT|nr:dynamin family protein [Hydrotalea sandarakina]PZX66067.1 small GTP-binding protein [Hydrotalea sandarakina]
MPYNNANISLLLNTAHTLEQDNLIDDIMQLQQKMHNEELNIVITGIFKRGKSSLINALIQENIMPTGVVPVTAIITILKYAATPSLEIFFKNKEKVTKPISSLNEFVSEEENPENIKNVAHVIVYHPAPILKTITIIDTPGVGSSFEHNTDTTLQFLNKIDVAIFVLSADMPISKTDIEFLQQLYAQIKNIVFVENKKDLLSATDLQKMLDHNKKTISVQLQMPIESITIIPISANQQLQGNMAESGFELLLQSLNSNISKNKSSILEQSIGRQLNLIQQSLISIIQLRINNLQLPVQQLSERIQQFENTQHVLLNEIEGFHAILQHHIKKLDETVHEQCNAKAKYFDATIQSLIQQYSNNNPFALLDITVQQALINDLNKLIKSGYEQLKTALEESSKLQFKSILEQYLFNSKNILHNIAIHFSDFLNTGIESIVEKFDWQAYTAFYITLNGLDKEAVINNNHTIFHFSKKSKEQQIIKSIQEQYHDIIIQNTAAIIYEVQYKIQESFRKFNADFKLKVQQLLQTLDKEMKATQAQTKNLNFNVQDTIAHLEAMKLQLNNS